MLPAMKREFAHAKKIKEERKTFLERSVNLVLKDIPWVDFQLVRYYIKLQGFGKLLSSLMKNL